MKPKSKRDPAAAKDVRGIDLDAVGRILEFMAQHSLEEFEYEAEGVRVRLKKPSANSNSVGRAPVLTPPEILYASPASPAQPAPAPTEPTPPREESEETGRGEDLHIVKSPIVGTFYEAPSPGAPPFVKLGDHVQVGQVLCIVEAMKLMNEIESDVAGEIVRIYVENGQPVEYGESLFAIRPGRKK
jgi:acetyl-CoA carboxylase biotin carboxyl carrier protein